MTIDNHIEKPLGLNGFPGIPTYQIGDTSLGDVEHVSERILGEPLSPVKANDGFGLFFGKDGVRPGPSSFSEIRWAYRAIGILVSLVPDNLVSRPLRDTELIGDFKLSVSSGLVHGSHLFGLLVGKFRSWMVVAAQAMWIKLTALGEHIGDVVGLHSTKKMIAALTGWVVTFVEYMISICYRPDLNGIRHSVGQNNGVIVESHPAVLTGITTSSNNFTSPVPAFSTGLINAFPEEIYVSLGEWR